MSGHYTKLVFDYLSENEVRGTRSDIAAAVGIPLNTLNHVLSTARQASFIEENGWTIPYVGRGARDGIWTVVRTKDPKFLTLFGARRMRMDVFHTLRSLSAQFNLLSEGARKGTKKQIKNKLIADQIDAAIDRILSIELTFNGGSKE